LGFFENCLLTKFFLSLFCRNFAQAGFLPEAVLPESGSDCPLIDIGLRKINSIIQKTVAKSTEKTQFRETGLKNFPGGGASANIRDNAF